MTSHSASSHKRKLKSNAKCQENTQDSDRIFESSRGGGEWHLKWVLEEEKKVGVEDLIQKEEVAGTQVCSWERSVYLEGWELAFVAKAHVGDYLGKGHGGRFVKGPLLHVKYK